MQLRVRLFIFAIAVSLLPEYIAAQSFSWGQIYGGTGADMSYGLATDAAGNNYITGSFTGYGFFNTTTFTSAGGKDFFLGKYSPSGQELWVLQGGGTLDDEGLSVDVDASGNVYVSGLTAGGAQFGNFSVAAASMFLLKYDSAGTFLWGRSFGGYHYAWDVSVDPAGNPYVAGYFSGTQTFGSQSLTSTGQLDGFVVSYSAAGTFNWAKQVGGAGDDMIYGICAHYQGRLMVTGRFANSASFGSITISGASGIDMFVGCLDALGNFLWANPGYGPGNDSGQDICTDPAGNVYVGGYFSQSANFGNNTYTSAGSGDGFVASYSLYGALKWFTPIASTGDDYCSGVCVMPSGSIAATGYFHDVVSFGAASCTSAGFRDVFVASLTSAGTWQWGLSGGGMSDEYGRNVSAYGNAVYFSGLSGGTGNYGTISIGNLGAGDAMLGKIELSGNGIEEESHSLSLELWPQPAPGSCTIRFYTEGGKQAKLAVYNMQGSLVREEEFETLSGRTEHKVGLSGLPEGLYQVFISCGNRTGTVSIIHQ